jgi:hypothetical protein
MAQENTHPSIGRRMSRAITAWSVAAVMALSSLFVATSATVTLSTAIAMESGGGEAFTSAPRKNSKTSTSSRRKTEEARKKREAKKKKRFSLFRQSGKTSASSKEKTNSAKVRRQYRKYNTAKSSLDRQEKRHAKNLRLLKQARSDQRTAKNNRAKAKANKAVDRYTKRAGRTAKDVTKAKNKVAEIRETLPRGVVILAN